HNPATPTPTPTLTPPRVGGGPPPPPPPPRPPPPPPPPPGRNVGRESREPLRTGASGGGRQDPRWRQAR
ncbi:hypothetical protein AAHZ94_29045, partial [Streptomyces sp. HSW2009]|uniref:hypothetical protein n=1 Tax=Streptomyces sp. HSW2009 TaxID=3142890 RepID=UPI0032ED1D16